MAMEYDFLESDTSELLNELLSTGVFFIFGDDANKIRRRQEERRGCCDELITS